MPPPGPRGCPAQLDVQGITFLLARVTWFTVTSRSCLRMSGSAGMLSGKFWTFAQGPVLTGTPACADIKTGLLGLQTAMLVSSGLAHALHAPLLALQDGLPQATEGYRMLAGCAKTRQNLYDVPAGCLSR